jgi:hypothetical protein
VALVVVLLLAAGECVAGRAGVFFGTAATLIVNPCSGSKNRHCVD